MNSKKPTYCCENCFSNAWMKQFIITNGQNGVCHFCGHQSVKRMGVEEVGIFFRERLENAFQNINTTQPFDVLFGFNNHDQRFLISKLIYDYDFFSKGLMEAAEIDPFNFNSYNSKCLSLVNELIRATEGKHNWRVEFDNSAAFTKLEHVSQNFNWDDNEYKTSWKNFKHYIMHFSRFFDFQSDGVFREKLFQEIANAASRAENIIEKGTEMWRARVMNGEQLIGTKKNVLDEIGPPPPRLAGASRMSPSGIAYTYLANDRDTCVAEIRPQVGDYLWAAMFRSLQPIKIIDLFSADRIPLPDFMNPLYEPKHASIPGFLKEFARELSLPVRDSEKDKGYIATQVVCEFIRSLGYGGIKFGSSLSNFKNLGVGGGKANYVLFCGPKRTKYEDIDNSTKIIPEFTDWIELDVCWGHTVYGVEYKLHTMLGAHAGGDVISFQKSGSNNAA